MNRRAILAKSAATLPLLVTLSAGAGASPDIAAGPHPDARLLALAERASQAREVELATHGDENAMEAACEVTDGLVRQMAAIPATTPDGFRAKARAANWYALTQHHVPDSDLTIDEVATRSLLRDLLAGDTA